MGIGFEGIGLSSGLPASICSYTGQIVASVENSFVWSECMNGRPKKINLVLPQHNDKTFVFPVLDDDGLPADITGATEIVWSIGVSANSPKLLTKTLTGGGVMLTGTDRFYVNITRAESAAMQTGVLRHDALITTATGLSRTPFYGDFDHFDTLAGDS